MGGWCYKILTPSDRSNSLWGAWYTFWYGATNMGGFGYKIQTPSDRRNCLIMRRDTRCVLGLSKICVLY